MSSLTLLQIVPSLAGSGLARATLDTVQAVVAAGGTAIVASPGGAMVPDLLRLRATHLELPPWSGPLRARLRLPPLLASSLRNADIDLILSRSPRAAWVAGALARRLKTKWIAALHQPFVATGMMERLAERRQLRADALVAMSAYVANDMRGREPDPAERLEAIPPGINLDRFDPALVRADRVIRLAADLRVPDGAHVVLYPGRFDKDRGHRLLIEAIRRLGHADVFCLLLGSVGGPTPFEKEVEKLIADAGLLGRVQIGPYVDDMPAAYMLADVVVSTGGKLQGFSRPMVEAQAMGRPVVAVDGGAAAEALLPGTTGWLATPGDAASLAEALNAALSLSPEARGDLARTAREHVRTHYSLAETNRRLLDLFGRVSA
ncbi:MAG: glycosyltransferase [Proteobacteria bacterium]|nr:glycosyltransferase [Pseudomonadota bacterium]